jgi:hypothetical protein
MQKAIKIKLLVWLLPIFVILQIAVLGEQNFTSFSHSFFISCAGLSLPAGLSYLSVLIIAVMLGAFRNKRLWVLFCGLGILLVGLIYDGYSYIEGDVSQYEAPINKIDQSNMWNLQWVKIGKESTIAYEYELSKKALNEKLTLSEGIEVEISNYYANALIRPSTKTDAIDGFEVYPVSYSSPTYPAIIINLRRQGVQEKVILWGSSKLPFVFKAGDDEWQLSLVRKAFSLPFELELKDFDINFLPNSEIIDHAKVTLLIKEGQTSIEEVINYGKVFSFKDMSFLLSGFHYDADTPLPIVTITKEFNGMIYFLSFVLILMGAWYLFFINLSLKRNVP